ncbi:MAG: hypothetical protein IPK19_20230 [Chloroflexi bacterium]|nr:hypothetical protein [Chloroflexota bacterium]
MAQLTIIDAFDDCIQRMASGESLERCLSRYPAFANDLRPLLETTSTLRRLRVPPNEVAQDQAIVWESLQRRMQTRAAGMSRGRRYMVQLVAAILLLSVMASAAFFALTRPDLPEQVIIDPVATTATPTASPSPSASPTLSATPSPTLSSTATGTLTSTPTATPTATPSQTPSTTPTATWTPTATMTPTPSATFAPGCGAPLASETASARVLEIYPNTTILSATQTVKFGGTLVWEVVTSHQIVVTFDVACGNILTIERAGQDSGAVPGGETNTNSNDNSNVNDNSGGSGSGLNVNSNDNDDDNDNDDSGSGGMGSDD